MRLLYLYPEEWTGRRAREAHTLSTCAALAREGVDVTLVTAGGLAEGARALEGCRGRGGSARPADRRALARAGTDPQHGDFLAQFQSLAADSPALRSRLYHSSESRPDPDAGGHPLRLRSARDFRPDAAKRRAPAQAARTRRPGTGPAPRCSSPPAHRWPWR